MRVLIVYYSTYGHVHKTYNYAVFLYHYHIPGNAVHPYRLSIFVTVLYIGYRLHKSCFHSLSSYNHVLYLFLSEFSNHGVYLF